MEPLNLVKEGLRVKIAKIDAGQGLTRRLKNMGLIKGEVIKVMQNTQGPLIIAKENLRFALGRGMSYKIFVEEVNKQ
ncbi:MAG: FeoA family protein [Candidatus Omnitrophota bacterium]